MLTHLAGEFIMNMGRTLRYLSEQRPSIMTPEVRVDTVVVSSAAVLTQASLSRKSFSIRYRRVAYRKSAVSTLTFMTTSSAMEVD